MQLSHRGKEKRMTEIVFVGVFIAGVVSLPILAYYVAKYWEIGRLAGRATYCKHRRVSDDERCRRLIRDGLRAK